MSSENEGLYFNSLNEMEGGNKLTDKGEEYEQAEFEALDLKEMFKEMKKTSERARRNMYK